MDIADLARSHLISETGTIHKRTVANNATIGNYKEILTNPPEKPDSSLNTRPYNARTATEPEPPIESYPPVSKYAIPKLEPYDPDESTYPITQNFNFAASPEKPYRVLWTTDYHIPFHDEKCLELILKFLEWFKPDAHIRTGDWHDFWAISKFRKDPRRLDRYNLQSELDCGEKILVQQHEVSPNTKELWGEGNHDIRLQNYLFDNQSALSYLRCLHLPRLIGLDKVNAGYFNLDDGVMLNGIYNGRHGELVRKFAGYSAKAHMDKHGGNGIHGHTHRMSHYTKRNRSGIYGWAENGCLCTLNPEYISYPDWQQGFSVQTWFSPHQYDLQQIHIINNRFYYGNKVFD
jgi:UDP-2,3-diacylglucosamine pyrophosphatase LpxH